MKDLNNVLNDMKIINFKKLDNQQGSGSEEYTNECLMEFKDQLVYQHLLKYYSKQQMDSIQKSMTETFLYTTIRINSMNTNKQSLIGDLENHFKENEKIEKNREIFTNFKSFDQIINNGDGNNDGGSEIKDQITNDTLFIKTVGPFVPKPIYPQLIVDTICGEAVLRGSNIFSVGVLGTNKYIKKGDLVSVFVTLEKGVSKGEIIEGCFKDKCAFIGNGLSLLDRDDYHQTKTGIAIEMTERIYIAPPLNSVLDDKMFLQHLPSILTVYQLQPKLGDKILDMCAAPGGKTTLIASLIQQQEANNTSTTNNNSTTTIIALDKNKSKVLKIQQLCKRLSLDKYVKCLTRDSSKLIKQDQQDPMDKLLFQENSFDKILLDGPCSGLGSRPRLIENSKLIDLTNASEFQKRLLQVAVSLLKPGGTLVYSTCTINPEENECNVAYVLNNYSNMKLVEQIPKISQSGLPNCGLSIENCNLVSRFDPSDGNIGTIGFFIAKFKKD